MKPIEITTGNFEELVKNSAKPVLVDFWAPWCGYCRRITPAIDQLAEQNEEQFVTGKINVDEQPELAQRFQVETIPTLLLFKDGKVSEPLIAPESKARILDWVAEQ